MLQSNFVQDATLPTMGYAKSFYASRSIICNPWSVGLYPLIRGSSKMSQAQLRLYWLILARPQLTQPRYYGLA